MTRHTLLAFLLWAVFTALGEVVVVLWDPQPLAAAEDADLVDNAFFVLMVMAVPIVAFVLATMVYSFIRFRQRGETLEDGPPVHSYKGVVVGWFTITTALTIMVIIYPGTIGLLDLRKDALNNPAGREADMLVEVQGSRWVWKITYPEQGVASFTEMVLPIGKEVRFDVTATDVLHAFWVPAFRMKIDAVPGQVTTVFATPNKTGSIEDDSGFRLQCAELCGVGHSLMAIPVRVVEAAEFEEWLTQQAPSASLTR